MGTALVPTARFSLSGPQNLKQLAWWVHHAFQQYYHASQNRRRALLGQGEACDGEAGNELEEPPGSPKRLRPNPAFLTGLVAGLKRTNERIIADTAANAACQVRPVTLPTWYPRNTKHIKELATQGTDAWNVQLICLSTKT